MKKVILISLLLMLGACAATVEVPQGEYVECKHLHSDEVILTRHFNNIQHVAVTDCPDIVRYRSGDCPALVKIITLDNRLEWLTQLEFENYECKQHEEN